MKVMKKIGSWMDENFGGLLEEPYIVAVLAGLFAVLIFIVLSAVIPGLRSLWVDPVCIWIWSIFTGAGV